MYRTSHFKWKLMHVLSILAHLGLVVAASASFLYDIGKTTGPVRTVQWSHYYPTGADVHPCSLAVMNGLGNGSTFDMATQKLLKTCLVVGSLGLTLNVALLALLLAVEPNRIMLTEGEQHWRKQIVTFFGCLLNLLLAAAGIGLAVTLGTKAADSKALIAPLIWASIQAPLAFATTVCDAVKNHREGKDLLD
ncbi:hypothetical protein C8A00DRAFT_30740 [Chaetomidium leptoderma]|uniref:Uncharacterized protein n=1 Tax=Chaetomidium leptoderma TaxID=669021 RepID=A0AAN6VR94_9PEZI|nr:hypothetical protein C8A00DRAFT_30740 [Chaetomidium leptoderma]